METINYYQIFIFLLEGLIVSSLLLFLFHLRKFMGMGVLYAALGLFQFLQVFLSLSVYVEITDSLIISPGSTILFSSSLFAVLLIYIKEDAAETRKLIYALLIANFIMTMLLYLISLNIEGSSQIITSNISASFFTDNGWVLFVGSILLFIDAVCIIMIYEYVSKYISYLYLRICVTMMAVLSMDAIVFSLAAFWNSETLSTVMISALVSKIVTVIFFSAIYTFYLKYIERDVYTPNLLSVIDVFNSLTYKQKYEKIEKAIQLSERRYQMLTDISPVGIYLTDPHGKFIYVNPSWSKISGIPRKGAVHDGWFKGVHPEDLEELQKSWRVSISRKEPSYNKFRFVHRDGSVYWVLSQLIPEFDNDEKNTGFVGTLTDITDLKLYEMELKRVKETQTKKDSKDLW